MASLQRNEMDIKVLVCNRGEIALRILQCLHELRHALRVQSRPLFLTTYALYTPDDASHIMLGQPDHALALPNAKAYMDISLLAGLVKEHGIDLVHPGYGFLSESAAFVEQIRDETGGMAGVVGPGADLLTKLSDKPTAKQLAAESNVPTLTAMSSPSSSLDDILGFADKVGYPLMLKASDGGGGRGIRLVSLRDNLKSAFQRCINESPSRSVFAEQAAPLGSKHIEVQIIGDGKGGVKHLWSRDCSVQRRFQKVVEIAPAPVPPGARGAGRLVSKCITAAWRMARTQKYKGLGTWEFLVDFRGRKFWFLEVNPRVQVEHTVTEMISGVDLVREQVLIALHELVDANEGKKGSIGYSFRENDMRWGEWFEAAKPPSQKYCVQWRLCAEDLSNNFSLSVGKIVPQDVFFPTGNGIRIDSHLWKGGVVGADFDNLLAKIIVTGASWGEVTNKSRRVLEEVSLGTGIKTNLQLLRGICADADFAGGCGKCDTLWLERNIERLIQQGWEVERQIETRNAGLPEGLSPGSSPAGNAAGFTPSSSSASPSGVLMKKGDSWNITLDPISSSPPSAATQTQEQQQHKLTITKLSRNQFPDLLVADISFHPATPSFSSTASSSQSQSYKATIVSAPTSTSTQSSFLASQRKPSKNGISSPHSGTLISLHTRPGMSVKKGQVLAVIRQMKMELEVRSDRDAKTAWVVGGGGGGEKNNGDEVEDEDDDDDDNDDSDASEEAERNADTKEHAEAEVDNVEVEDEVQIEIREGTVLVEFEDDTAAAGGNGNDKTEGKTKVKL